MAADQPATAACGAPAKGSDCVCDLPAGHPNRHHCEHGTFGSLDPIDERLYAALTEAGFDESDAERATRIALEVVNA